LKLAGRTIRIKGLDHLGFKIKNICDEELASLHHDYLEKQSEFLDECIKEVLNKIKTCLVGKATINTRNICNK